MKQITTKFDKCCECPRYIEGSCAVRFDRLFSSHYANKEIHPDCPLDDVADGCEYCKESKALHFDNFHYVREIYIELDGSLSVSMNLDNEVCDEDINRPISFCPLCGCRLPRGA